MKLCYDMWVEILNYIMIEYKDLPRFLSLRLINKSFNEIIKTHYVLINELYMKHIIPISIDDKFHYKKNTEIYLNEIKYSYYVDTTKIKLCFALNTKIEEEKMVYLIGISDTNDPKNINRELTIPFSSLRSKEEEDDIDEIIKLSPFTFVVHAHIYYINDNLIIGLKAETYKTFGTNKQKIQLTKYDEKMLSNILKGIGICNIYTKLVYTAIAKKSKENKDTLFITV